MLPAALSACVTNASNNIFDEISSVADDDITLLRINDKTLIINECNPENNVTQVNNVTSVNNATNEIIYSQLLHSELEHSTSDTESENNNAYNYNNDNHQPINNCIQMKNTLTIMVWNVQGLSDKMKDNDFVNYISKYDVIIFLETMKLDNYKPELDDYTYKHYQRKYQHPKARKPSGGIGILIKTGLFSNGCVTVAKNSDFSVWLKIKQSNNNSLYLGGIYIPPLDSSSTISSFHNNNAFQIIQEEVTHFNEIGDVALCGDFNARTGNLKDFSLTPSHEIVTNFGSIELGRVCEFDDKDRFSEDTKNNKYGKELVELCKTSDMRIMNGYFMNDIKTGEYTCYTSRGRSLIDYLICNYKFYQSLLTFKIDPLSVNSDHRPLLFSLKVQNEPTVSKQSLTLNNNLNTRFYRYVFNIEGANSLSATITGQKCTLMHDQFLDCVIGDTGVNEVVSSMYTLLETAISENFPKKYQKSIKNSFPTNEWFDDECKNLKRLTNDFAKHHDLNLECNLTQYHSLKRTYKATMQRKKRLFQNKIRNELEALESQNPIDYWKYWDRLNKNNKCQTTNGISLDTFEKYFVEIQSPPSEARSNFDMQYLSYVEEFMKNIYDSPLSSNLYMTDLPISVHEVQTELKSLKLGKAPGIDGISNEFYKYLSDHLLQPLTTLFNYIWEKGIYPDKWSQGIIQPLHKKGSYNEPDNYRKLTLMACMGKIFESILNKRLTFQSEATGIVDPYQFGFKKGCRTSDNVFILDTLISYNKLNRKPLFVTFVDFSKAFDFVNRPFLYYKMIKKGFGGRLVRIIQSMFDKSCAKVRWHGELGNSIDSTHGVLQGGIVSPKLFNLYLSDLCEYLDLTCGITINGKTYTHLLYADDLVLISETAVGMQKLLHNLEAYCRKWHLIINSQKSKVMLFHMSKTKISQENFKFQIENETLEIVNSYKYLGHIISNSRNVHKSMYDHLATQAQKALYALKEKINSTVGYLPPKLHLKMFDTHIMPILEYNCEVWFPEKQIDILEKIQISFLKNMLSVRSQTSTVAILADTGKFPLIVRQQKAAIKFFDRLRSNKCAPLLQSCFDIQKEMYERGFSCWLSRLYAITQHFEFGLDSPNLNKIILSLYDQNHDKIMNDISDSVKNPKLRTYKLMKTDIRLEPYLNYSFPKSVYCNIARFRLSSHNLNIELGRHKRPFIPADRRICEKCILNVVEDEFHCLMICEKWNNSRAKLLEVAQNCINDFFIISKEEQFLQMLTSKDIDLIYALGKFLQQALKVENKIVHS